MSVAGSSRIKMNNDIMEVSNSMDRDITCSSRHRMNSDIVDNGNNMDNNDISSSSSNMISTNTVDNTSSSSCSSDSGNSNMVMDTNIGDHNISSSSRRGSGNNNTQPRQQVGVGCVDRNSRPPGRVRGLRIILLGLFVTAGCPTGGGTGTHVLVHATRSDGPRHPQRSHRHVEHMGAHARETVTPDRGSVGEPLDADGEAEAQGGANPADPESCRGSPKADVGWLQSGEGKQGGEHTCVGYDKVCLDQGAFVMHDPRYNLVNGSAMPTFKIEDLGTTWRAPHNDPINGVISGARIHYTPLMFRPPVAGDPDPVFSNCTLPVILFKDKENSFNHVLLSLLAQLHWWYSNGAVNDDVTYVLGTPWGAEVPGFLHPIMRPFSPYQVQSLADFSSRLPPTTPSSATAEGLHVRCFEKVVLCKVVDHLEGWLPGLAGQAPAFLHHWYLDRGLLPDNPVGFRQPQSTEGDRALMVLIETRAGVVRNLDNQKELIRQCNEAGGPWECRGWAMGKDFATDLAAVHSADIFVFIHGSAATNLIFMRNDTAVVEVMPFGFAAANEGFWPRVFSPDLTRNANFRVWYFALNIEDPALSRPSRWEAEGVGESGLWVRDRHVTLPWQALELMLKKIHSLSGQKDKYLTIEKAGNNIVEVLPEGKTRRGPQAIERFAEARLVEVQGWVDDSQRLTGTAKEALEKGDTRGASDAVALAHEHAIRAVNKMNEVSTVFQRAHDAGRYVNTTLVDAVAKLEAASKRTLSAVEHVLTKRLHEHGVVADEKQVQE